MQLSSPSVLDRLIASRYLMSKTSYLTLFCTFTSTFRREQAVLSLWGKRVSATTGNCLSDFRFSDYAHPQITDNWPKLLNCYLFPKTQTLNNRVHNQYKGSNSKLLLLTFVFRWWTETAYSWNILSDSLRLALVRMVQHTWSKMATWKVLGFIYQHGWAANIVFPAWMTQHQNLIRAFVACHIRLQVQKCFCFDFPKRHCSDTSVSFTDVTRKILTWSLAFLMTD